MKINVNGRKLDITEDLRAYAVKKLSKLDRFFVNDSDATVICRTERGRYTAEATVRSANMYFRAQYTTGDMYAAIDEVEDMIERQIRKNKTRLEKRLRNGAFEREISVSADNAPEDEYNVIRRKQFSMKPMSVEEAILQMNMLDHQFYAFKNADNDNRFSVVYKRANGGYGIIESD